MSTVSVAALFVHPVKSMRGVARERARMMARGLEWDRQWMVIDGKGTFLSQRTHPRLARIVPEITDTALRLTAPEVPELSVPLDHTGERVAVRVWRDCCVGIDQSAAAHAWVSGVLGEPVRLVRVAPDMERSANPEFTGPVPAPLGFADGYPLLVCNEASLADLNERLPAPLTIERFRPNIVVRGLSAWAEDRIDTLVIGAITIRLVKPCTRCSIPSLDPVTGERSTDPLPVLRQFRFDRSLLGVTFGENAVIVRGAGCVMGRGDLCTATYL